jgi:hypothetical protein
VSSFKQILTFAISEKLFVGRIVWFLLKVKVNNMPNNLKGISSNATASTRSQAFVPGFGTKSCFVVGTISSMTVSSVTPLSKI